MESISHSKWVLVNVNASPVLDHVASGSFVDDGDDDPELISLKSSSNRDSDSSFDIIDENVLGNEGKDASTQTTAPVKTQKSKGTQISSGELSTKPFSPLLSLTIAVAIIGVVVYQLMAQSSQTYSMITTAPYGARHFKLQKQIRMLHKKLRSERQKNVFLLRRMKHCLDENTFKKEFLDRQQKNLVRIEEIFDVIVSLNYTIKNATLLNDANSFKQETIGHEIKVDSSFLKKDLNFDQIKSDKVRGIFEGNKAHNDDDYTKKKFTKNRRINLSKQPESFNARKARKVSESKIGDFMKNEHFDQLLKYGSNIFTKTQSMFKRYMRKFSIPIKVKKALPLFNEFKKLFHNKLLLNAPLKQKHWFLCQYIWWGEYLNITDHDKFLSAEWDFTKAFPCDVFGWQKMKKILKSKIPLTHEAFNGSYVHVENNTNEKLDRENESKFSGKANGEWYFRRFRPAEPENTWYLWMLERSVNKNT